MPAGSFPQQAGSFPQVGSFGGAPVSGQQSFSGGGRSRGGSPPRSNSGAFDYAAYRR
jgi:hypothetical protein